MVRLCGCLCFVWVVVLFVCLGVFLVCFFFVVCFLFFVFRFLHSKCDKGSGLCIGPLPVYFCGHYSFGPCTSQLINLICNMLGNMLNDLAEAIRRWTEKNQMSWQAGHCLVSSSLMACAAVPFSSPRKVMQGTSRAADYRAYRLMLGPSAMPLSDTHWGWGSSVSSLV